jgi:hypothetical protein
MKEFVDEFLVENPAPGFANSIDLAAKNKQFKFFLRLFLQSN